MTLIRMSFFSGMSSAISSGTKNSTIRHKMEENNGNVFFIGKKPCRIVDALWMDPLSGPHNLNCPEEFRTKEVFGDYPIQAYRGHKNRIAFFHFLAPEMQVYQDGGK